MYEPEGQNRHFLLIVAAISSLIAWAFFNYYRPILIEASCSDIALGTSSMNYDDENSKRFSYENTKARCIEEIKYNIDPF